MRKTQLSLFKQSSSTSHGGDLAKGRRKVARPLHTKQPMHVVLRASRAKGEWSFLRGQNRAMVSVIVPSVAKRFRIKLIKFVNVGNHLHLIVQGARRRDLQAFFRVLPPAITFAVTGARKGNPVGRFFDKVLFTRVIAWGHGLERALEYLWKNQLEALGIPPLTIAEWRRADAGFRAALRMEAGASGNGLYSLRAN